MGHSTAFWYRTASIGRPSTIFDESFNSTGLPCGCRFRGEVMERVFARDREEKPKGGADDPDQFTPSEE